MWTRTPWMRLCWKCSTFQRYGIKTMCVSHLQSVALTGFFKGMDRTLEWASNLQHVTMLVDMGSEPVCVLPLSIAVFMGMNTNAVYGSRWPWSITMLWLFVARLLLNSELRRFLCVEITGFKARPALHYTEPRPLWLIYKSWTWMVFSQNWTCTCTTSASILVRQALTPWAFL